MTPHDLVVMRWASVLMAVVWLVSNVIFVRRREHFHDGFVGLIVLGWFAIGSFLWAAWAP